MSERFVEIETGAVRRTGEQISELAAETRTLVNSVRNDIENMGSYWSGGDEAEYVKMALENTDKTNKLLDSFEGAGVGIKQTADNYQKESEEFQAGIRSNGNYE